MCFPRFLSALVVAMLLPVFAQAEPEKIDVEGQIELLAAGKQVQEAIEELKSNLAASQDKPQPAADAPDLSGLSRDELAIKLGDPSFGVRNAAQDGLRSLFAENVKEMMEFCFELFRDTPDPEIRMRSRELLVEHISSVDAVTEGRGFVGILLNLHAFFDRKGELVTGVRAQEIVAGSPALAAGMRPADLIVKIDDLDVGVRNGDRLFQEYVAAKRPGTKVRMKVLRGDNVIDVELVLARRPEAGTVPAPPDPEEVFRDWLRQRMEIAD